MGPSDNEWPELGVTDYLSDTNLKLNEIREELQEIKWAQEESAKHLDAMKTSLKALTEDVQSFTASFELSDLTSELKPLAPVVKSGIEALSLKLDMLIGAKRSNAPQWILVALLALIGLRLW
jgi:chromosome segregation ATPase